MPYREISIDPPFDVQAGDEFPFVREASSILQVRAGNIIATRVVSFPGLDKGNTPPAVSAGTYDKLLYWEERKVPGTTLSITNIRRGTVDQVYIDFSNGEQREIATLEDMAAIADAVDASAQFAQDVLIAKAYRESPDGSNLGASIGSQISVNCAAGVVDPIVFTPAE